jgi:hypothetical protein
MSSDPFYVTLLSDSSKHIYAENRPANYTNDLNSTRLLEGKWEVGLRQAQFTNNWPHSTPQYTFIAWYGVAGRTDTRPRPADPYGSVIQFTMEPEIPFDIRNMDSKLVTIPAGKWTHVTEIANAVAQAIQDAFRTEANNLFVTYIRNTVLMRTTFITQDSSYIGITSEDDELWDILGVSPRRESKLLRNPKMKLYMFEDHNMRGREQGLLDSESVFVYSDICEEQAIGDGVGKLLKVLPVTAKKGERQSVEYDNPTYVRVTTGNLRTINIRFCDRAGEEIEFSSLRSFTTVQLHFRKCE